MTPRSARLLLGGALGLATVESLASPLVYRNRLDDTDWAAVRDQLEAEVPLYVGTGWLEPSARMRLEPAARLEHVARPDLRGQSRIAVLGVGGDGWSTELESDLEDLPRPQREGTTYAGALSISTYRLDAGERVDDVLARSDLEVATSAGPCRPMGPTWKCPDGSSSPNRIAIETVEVDYRPRRCLVVELDDGEQARVRIDGFGLGNVLRGHVGVDDFNARLRSDAPLELEVRVDGTTSARWTFSDEQGWVPFAVATAPGQAVLELVLTPGVRGTWGRTGHQSAPPHRFCVEVRSFTEATP